MKIKIENKFKRKAALAVIIALGSLQVAGAQSHYYQLREIVSGPTKSNKYGGPPREIVRASPRGGAYSAVIFSDSSNGENRLHSYQWTFESDISTLAPGDIFTPHVRANKDGTGTTARVVVQGSDGALIANGRLATPPLTKSNFSPTDTRGRAESLAGQKEVGTATSSPADMAIRIDPKADSENIVIRVYLEGAGKKTMSWEFLYIYEKVGGPTVSVAPNTPSQNAAKNTEIQVPATQKWTRTGLVVRAGDRLRFEAGGSVEMSPATDLRSFYHNVPPEGRDDRIGYLPAPQLPALSLLGRVGNGPVFGVGKGGEMTIPGDWSTGELYLGINDDIVSDNAGFWKVRVTTWGRR